MVGGCLSCFLAYISLLLLGVCLHDVETSSCELINIHKKVGDTVELSSCLPTEGVIIKQWRHKGLITEEKDVFSKPQFKDRLELNPTSFNLTVSRLTLQDSGQFQFVSEVNDKQRKTVIINLQVHEPITVEPTVSSSFSWYPVNESCTVLLECSATTDRSVTYSWAVRNETLSGSWLIYNITPENGDTGFTCTISNFVSEKSSSVTVKCNSDPQEPGLNFVLLLSAAGGACLMIVVIVGVAIYVCHCKQSPAGSDSNDLTVYADIADVRDRGSSTMMPCTLYETIENRVATSKPGPQTVYDEIQLSRMRKASVSPYQEVS